MESRPPTTDAGDLELLRRYRPLLAYDEQAEHRALALETAVETSGNLLVRGREALASADGEGNRRLSLDLLARMTTGEEADEDDRLVMTATAAAICDTQDAARFPAVAYGRVVEDGEHLWLQYWLWFYFRLGNLFGWRQHQGAWELLQVGLDPDGHRPQVLTAKSGDEDVAARWDEVARWRECDDCGGACEHPVAKVALFTHDLDFEPANGDAAPGPATMPERCLPEVRPLGEWAGWPGRWGATDREWGFGKSPRGPVHQSRGWESPKKIHRKANEWRLNGDAADKDRPTAPAVRAAWVDKAAVVVEVVTPAKRGQRPRWLFVTVHEPEASRVIRKRIARARKSGLTVLRIPLLQFRPGYDTVTVCVSSFDRRRRRSEVVEACMQVRQTPATDGAKWKTWNRRIWRRFHHGLLSHLDEHGALTAAELRGRSPQILDLPLTDAEVDELLESARRHGLVEPLDGPNANGHGNADLEWAPSERGRERIGGPLQMGSGLFKFVPLALIVPVAVEQSKNLDSTGARVLAGTVVLGTLFLLGVAVFLIHHVLQGALPRTVANSWDRHAVELPALNRWYRRPARYAVYLLGGALMIGLALAATLFETSGDGDTALGLTALIAFYATALLVGADLVRVALLKKEAANTRPKR